MKSKLQTDEKSATVMAALRFERFAGQRVLDWGLKVEVDDEVFTNDKRAASAQASSQDKELLGSWDGDRVQWENRFRSSGIAFSKNPAYLPKEFWDHVSQDGGLHYLSFLREWWEEPLSCRDVVSLEDLKESTTPYLVDLYQRNLRALDEAPKDERNAYGGWFRNARYSENRDDPDPLRRLLRSWFWKGRVIMSLAIHWFEMNRAVHSTTSGNNPRDRSQVRSDYGEFLKSRDRDLGATRMIRPFLESEPYRDFPEMEKNRITAVLRKLHNEMWRETRP